MTQRFKMPEMVPLPCKLDHEVSGFRPRILVAAGTGPKSFGGKLVTNYGPGRLPESESAQPKIGIRVGGSIATDIYRYT